MSLKIQNLNVKLASKKILQDIDLEINKGKIHVLMGPNGSGKSTLANVLMGNNEYVITNKNYTLEINGKDIRNLKTDERARLGLFLAFQNPTSIPGVNVSGLLKTAYQFYAKKKDTKIKKTYNPVLSIWKFNEMLLAKSKFLGIPQDFLRRSLNEAFSGGEKKKLEMLQAIILQPKYAIFDEIDTGLDVDALKVVAKGIASLKREGSGILIITHYQRILRFARPDYVHIIVGGRIVAEGNYKLAIEIEKNGYKKWIK